MSESGNVRKYKDKKILLFCPSNNNYPITIKNEIELEGGDVHFYDERGNPNTIDKIIYRKTPCILKKKIEHYYRSIIETEKNFKPDVVLVISPEAVTIGIIHKMKKVFSKARFILYMWDSIENKQVSNMYKLFDKCFSFDRRDCKKYGFIFRPLFFSQEYEINNAKDKHLIYDFGFIGSMHSDRARIINSIRKYCERKNLKYYFYIYVQGKLMLFLWLVRSSDVRELYKKGYIHIKTLDRAFVEKKMEQTRYVIDINHPQQTGLTMRTIEMLGLKKKLLTTNKNIQEYDFYNPVNQIVIDRDKIDFDENLIREPYIEVDENIYRKYSISHWIYEVLN